MRYVDENLAAGEHVLHKSTTHWFIFLPGTVFLIGGVALFLTPTDTAIWGQLLIALALLQLAGAVVHTLTTEAAVPNQRFIAKTGLLKIQLLEMKLANIESFRITQSLFGSRFRFRTLTVGGTGGASIPIPYVAKPMDFRRVVMDVINPTTTHGARAP